MKAVLPLYIHENRPEGKFEVRLLFHPELTPELTKEHEFLHKALEKLNLELRKQVRALGKQARHEDLARLLFSPPLRTENLRLQLSLRRRSLNLRLLMVSFTLQGFRLAMSPALPELWFLLGRGQSLAVRAQEVYEAWFRRLEAEEPERLNESWGLGEKDNAWLSELELEVETQQKLPSAPDLRKLIALFSGGGKPDGEAELEQVGRCLNWLYPDGLLQAIGREAEIERLLAWMTHADRRPVVIVGPPGVGKTALVHACVRQLTGQRRNRWDSHDNVWQLAPQRLISGMIYVGQWEERLLAILETAAKKRLTLYFDDLPGLFEAGISRDSSMNVVQILRSWIEERKLRVVAEASPEAWQLVQEKDRGLADQFSVLQLQVPSEAQALPMLLELMRGIEDAQGCAFAPESLLLTLSLLRRFVRDTVLPGKAARLLQQLAARHKGQALPIGRAQVLEAFHHFSGLNPQLLETDKPLRREEVVAALQQRVIGQSAAVETLADMVTLARARLNDPERPLASLLFLGPTGVGKTECAKALAAYLFGAEDRLLRFDMNEYGTAHAAQRLIGTWAEPEGLLTAAVRRQPFAVLLFDEIEKADASVYDLLLQVLGEGRLSDARGRTADFTQTLIVLTSNLGVREAGRSMGFTSASDAGRSYLKSAEAFFRPEFFNRLDRIVPFAPLSREEIARIAGLLIGKLFAREGLVRRRSMLRIHPAAMEQVIDLGYHPQLGARALKRALERQLAQPVGMALAELRPDTPTLIAIAPGQKDPAGQPELTVTVQALQQVSPRPFPDLWAGATPRQLWQKLDEWTDASRPQAVAPSTANADQTDEGAYHRLMIAQLWRELRDELDEIGQGFEESRMQSGAHLGFKQRRSRYARLRGSMSKVWENLFAAQDLHEALLELIRQHQDETPAQRVRLEALATRCSLLAAMAGRETGSGRWLVQIQAMDTHSTQPLAQQARLLKHALQLVPGLDCEQLENLHGLDRRCLLVEGLHAPALLAWEAGIHLHVGDDNRMMPLEVHYQALTGAPESALAGQLLLSPTEREVVRLYHGKGTVLDWRSGGLWDAMPTPEELLGTWLRLLDLPASFIPDQP
ncbi:MAG TPA: AAA family ATPase [Candidatus Obscuribacterales bacterium]